MGSNLLPVSCVALDKHLTFPKLCYLICTIERDNNSNHLRRLLRGLNEIVHLKPSHLG